MNDSDYDENDNKANHLMSPLCISFCDKWFIQTAELHFIIMLLVSLSHRWRECCERNNSLWHDYKEIDLELIA